MSTAWYENFFEGLMLELWRKAVPPEQTELEADFLEKHLRLDKPSRVLDVPCGFGRHSIALASRGHQMTGVDVSPQMIDEAKKDAATAKATIDWRNAEMRELPWVEEFDAAFCFGNSFGYLDAEGTRTFTRSVARALKPGGRFALDYGMAAECILPRLQGRERAEIGDILFLEENIYNAEESCVETTYQLKRGDESVTRKGPHWVYTVREIKALLAEAGLRTVSIFQSLDEQAFSVGSSCLILVAEKTTDA